MAAVWYCKIGDRQYGPLGFDQLQRLAAAGKLSRKSHVRQGEQGSWTTAASIAGLFDAPKSVVTSPPARRPGGAAPPRPARGSATARPPAPRAVARAAPEASGHVEPASGFDLPLGQAMASTQTLASGESAVLKRGESKSSARRGRKKQQVPMPLVIGGGAGVLITLGVLIGVMYYTFTRHDEPKAVAKTADTKKPAEAATATAEAKGKTGPEANKAAEGEKLAEGAKEAGPLPTNEERLALIKGASGWSDATVGRQAKVDTLTVHLLNHWRSDLPSAEPAPAAAPAAEAKAEEPAAAPEEKPEEAEPKNPKGAIDSDIAALLDQATAASQRAKEAASKAAAAAKPKPAKPVAAAESAAPKAPGKYFFVEVKIENHDEHREVKYVGWGSENKSAAILAVNGEKLCPLVPMDKAPLPSRHANIVLAPGDQVTDVLVFEAPEGDVVNLKLLLPLTAIGRRGNIAVNIPAAIITDGPHRQTEPGPELPVAQVDGLPDLTAEPKAEAEMPAEEPKQPRNTDDEDQAAASSDLERLLLGNGEPEMKTKKGAPNAGNGAMEPPEGAAAPKQKGAPAAANNGGPMPLAPDPVPLDGGAGPPPGAMVPVPGDKPPPGAVPLPVR